MKRHNKLLIAMMALLICAMLLSACNKVADRLADGGVSFGPAESTTEESTEKATETTTEKATETTTEKAAETTAEETTEESSDSEAGEYPGETFSCVMFSAVCPEGWSNYPLMDFWDKTKQEETALQFLKGEAESDWDIYNLANVRITCYPQTTTVLESKSIYDNVEDYSLTDSEGREWSGFTGDYSDKKNYWLKAEFDEHIFVATGFLNGSKSEYALEDEDFIAILSSCTVNEEEEESAESSAEETTEESAEESSEETEEASTEESSEEETTESTTEKPAETTTETTTEAAKVYDARKNVTVSQASSGETTVTFEELPQSAEDLEAIVSEFGLEDPKLTAAWFIASLSVFPEDPKECERMVGILSIPSEARSLAAFVMDQVNQKQYLSTAYFEGAAPDNDFTPNEPYTVRVSDYDNRENNALFYVQVTADADTRDRTIAFTTDEDGNYLVIKCPALMLGMY